MVAEFGRSTTDKTFIFVNKRPIEMKELERLLRRVFSEAAGVEAEKFPVSALSIQIGPEISEKIDHNLEPNKLKVGLGCLPVLLDSVEEFIRRKHGIGQVSFHSSFLCGLHSTTLFESRAHL